MIKNLNTTKELLIKTDDHVPVEKSKLKYNQLYCSTQGKYLFIV